MSWLAMLVQVVRLVEACGACRSLRRFAAPGPSVVQFMSRVARQHELHGGGLDRARRHLVQGLQHFHAALGMGLGAVDLELLVAVGNLDLQRDLDGAQVFVHGAAQVGQAGVVGREKRWRRIKLIIPVKGAGVTPEQTTIIVTAQEIDTHDRQAHRHPPRKEPTRSAGGLPRRGLRGPGVHEHLLQPARSGREGQPADALRGARRRAAALRLRHRGRARGLSPAHQDLGRRARARRCRCSRA